ncbi:MAG: hypothetical protein Q4E35_04035, partial [Eubacteriales bacterium]|nr:hypothetical protein [Eubacteriales bacterium]
PFFTRRFVNVLFFYSLSPLTSSLSIMPPMAALRRLRRKGQGFDPPTVHSLQDGLLTSCFFIL